MSTDITANRKITICSRGSTTISLEYLRERQSNMQGDTFDTRRKLAIVPCLSGALHLELLFEHLLDNSDTHFDAGGRSLSYERLSPLDERDRILGKVPHDHTAWGPVTSPQGSAYLITESLGHIARNAGGSGWAPQPLPGSNADRTLVIWNAADPFDVSCSSTATMPSRVVWRPWSPKPSQASPQQALRWIGYNGSATFEHWIAVVSLDQLRNDGLIAPGSLWWPSLTHQVEKAVKERCPKLAQCGAVVVNIPATGAVVIRKDLPPLLIAVPDSPDGEWLRQRTRGVMGNTWTMVVSAALDAACVTAHETDKDQFWHTIIDRAVQWTRSLNNLGFHTHKEAAKAEIHPFERLTYEVFERHVKLDPSIQGILKEAKFIRPKEIPPPITAPIRLDKHFVLERPSVEAIVIDGKPKTPVFTIGGLTCVDECDVEQYRSLLSLFSNYLKSPQQRPMSVAVFGTPGSGKSFGVEQVARASDESGGYGIEKMEFNLSQFSSADDLIGAFHQIRDKALEGKIPLVFWDEFDTTFANKPFGWLRYFLAPMQDGRFSEGDITHMTGRAIYVFAGGVCTSFADFAKTALAEAKGPDFCSRLTGHINIQSVDHPTKDCAATPDAVVALRRHFILAGMLKKLRPRVELTLSTELRRAFLCVPRFTHGSRSMEQILRMCQIPDNSEPVITLSHLPSPSQLAMHVDARQFIELAQRKPS